MNIWPSDQHRAAYMRYLNDMAVFYYNRLQLIDGMTTKQIVWEMNNWQHLLLGSQRNLNDLVFPPDYDRQRVSVVFRVDGKVVNHIEDYCDCDVLIRSGRHLHEKMVSFAL